jgi:hypothetical protein
MELVAWKENKKLMLGINAPFHLHQVLVDESCVSCWSPFFTLIKNLKFVLIFISYLAIIFFILVSLKVNCLLFVICYLFFDKSPIVILFRSFSTSTKCLLKKTSTQ